MNNQAFSKIWILILLVLTAAGGILAYQYWKIPEEEDKELGEGQGVDIPSEEEVIRVLFPKGKEQLEIGKTYEISWENYIEDEPLTIGLQVALPDGRGYVKHIAENVPATASGTYGWTVTSERADSRYKIEVYPEINRAIVGRSKDFFSITGDSLIVVNTPQPLEEITSLLKITGKARQIFSEGEFIVRLRKWGAEVLKNSASVKFPPIAEAIARAKNCDWASGDWCDFEAELSVPLEKLKDKAWMIEFCQKDERFGEKLVYEFLVIGEQMSPGQGFLEISSPFRNQEVTSPIVITGRARNIENGETRSVFVDGKFRVMFIAEDYPYGHPKEVEGRLVDSVNAVITDDSCDYMVGEWCEFRAVINYQPSEIGKERNYLYFYRGGGGKLGERFLFAWPVKSK